MSERNPYFDNAKAILIFLVVLGHILSEFLYENSFISSLYLFIFLFHMPAFILISGYFARGVHKRGYIKNLAKKLLVPYIVFQVFYTFYYVAIFGNDVSISLFTPRWALWFLLSLFLWNVMLLLFTKIRFGLLVAVSLSLLIGYISQIDGFLSLSRTFFFFPFFLLGYYLKKEHFIKLTTNPKKVISLGIMALLFIVVYLIMPIDERAWLMGKQPYENLGDVSLEFAWLARSAVYLIMAVVTFLFLSLVPTRKTFFTHIGQYTITIYLLHMLLVKLLHESPLVTMIIKQDLYWLLVVFAFVIVYLLSRKTVRLLMKPIIK
ncbi:acyltransferase family protein [Halalkalibacter krulwichiae]|uniref:Acyltransferase family protein n=1 Tax=Halalkalibacter krulwichiae TaxID=199441 RepID=A0A1X9MG65_9BACI|nr:acyltransferase family protein [Halalkalibacter krulwichiae]ARK30511.1 Acyltransferase family protein [Halalkalibacter krulwichiae]